MKKIPTFLFVLFVSVAVSQNLSLGLQACYPLDGNALNLAPTGAALNGTISSVTTGTGRTGANATAYKFNGTVGSYIKLPDHPGLKSDSVFFSGWFRVDSIPQNPQAAIEYMVYTNNGCPSNFEAYSLDLQNGASNGVYAFCLTKSGSNCGIKPQICSTITPVVGTWYHIGFYISNSVMKLYVNGTLHSSITHTVQWAYQPGKQVFLGVTNEPNFNRPFKGAMDNIRFYNRELSLQEVGLLYTQDPPCKTVSDVSVDEVNPLLQAFEIFPSPANSHVIIPNLGENTVYVTDLFGRQLQFEKRRMNNSDGELDLRDAASGIYFVQILNTHGILVSCSKLVISR